MKNKFQQDMKTLIPNFKGYLFLSFFMALGVQLIGLVPPLLMKKIIDELIPAGKLKEVLLTILLFILLPLCLTALNTLYKFLLALIARRSGRALTLQAFENVLQQKMSYFDENKSGELATFIRQETMRYVMFWLADLPQLAAHFLISGVVIVYLGSYHIGLALLLLAYYPLAFFPSNYFGKVVANFTGKIITSNGKMAQIITDTVRNIRLVKAYELEKQQVAKLKNTLTEAIGIWSRVAFFDNLTGLWITNFSNQLILGVVFAFSAVLVIKGNLTLGGIVIILSYLNIFFASASQILNTNYQFKKQLAEFKPLADLLHLKNTETSGEIPFETFEILRFSNVKFHYTKERGDILNDLSLTLKKGEWLGFVGKSGTGKSTIFDLILRFYTPQAGDIQLNERPLSTYSLVSLREKMTLVSQQNALFPGTIAENLRLGKKNASEAELNEVLEEVALLDFVESLPAKLETLVGEDGALISGGQKQRLNLAQGFLRETPILLLDEVSSALDSKTAQQIKQAIKRRQEQKHLTILSVSHDFHFLDLCDAVYEIHEGKASKK